MVLANEATPKTSFLSFDGIELFDMSAGVTFATFKDKSNGIKLFDTSAAVTFDGHSIKHSWIQRVSLIGLEESMQGAEELELNVKVSSLKELDLSNLALSDAISSIDLGSFSFLEDLDLSGNGFFNLPSSISRLPKLQCLTVERCKNLLSISELPSSVLYLSINDCTSIERVSAPLQHEKLPLLNVRGCRNLIEIQGMEFAGNNWSILNLDDCNYKMSLIQGLCRGKYYDICLAGGEIPEWFSYRGEGSALSFHLPSVSVPDGNKLQALLVWVVSASTNEATPQTSFLQFDKYFATFKNKSNGIELFDTTAAVTFDRNSTKHSWIQRVPLTRLEESLQGVEELELNVKVRLIENVRKCWVEKCGVHLVIEKSKADSDIHGEKRDHEIVHALGSSTTDDQRLESSLIRELQKWKISDCLKIG